MKIGFKFFKFFEISLKIGFFENLIFLKISIFSKFQLFKVINFLKALKILSEVLEVLREASKVFEEHGLIRNTLNLTLLLTMPHAAGKKNN